jgi:hypothetical protein
MKQSKKRNRPRDLASELLNAHAKAKPSDALAMQEAIQQLLAKLEKLS